MSSSYKKNKHLISILGFEAIKTCWEMCVHVYMIVHIYKPVRSARVCATHCVRFVTGRREKFKWSKSNKTILHVRYETEMLQHCLRSTGRAFWLPLHGVTRLISITLQSLSVKRIFKSHTTFVKWVFTGWRRLLVVIKKKSYLLFIFKGYLDFRYIILLIIVDGDMFGQGSY